MLEDPSAAPGRALMPVLRCTTRVSDLLLKETITRGWMLTGLDLAQMQRLAYSGASSLWRQGSQRGHDSTVDELRGLTQSVF